MKNQILKVATLVCLISMPLLWYACQEEPSVLEKGEVSFTVISASSSELKRKSTKVYDLNDVEKVIITIQESDGTPTDYTQYELNIYKMGDVFITKKIALTFGSYKVTEFYIVDALDSIIFASPIEGSLMAQNVNDPLPVLFDVTQKSKAVNIEVVSTENLKPEDFGLIRFPVIEVETFQFLINVSEVGTDQLLNAYLTITSGGYIYSQQLDSVVENIVTLKDGYVDYILSIESTGYQTIVDTLTNTELKQYYSIPLIVELEELSTSTEGLVAYYPFNGNANDLSGNNNNGTVHGSTLTSDRFGNLNSAYLFDGNDDYIDIEHSQSLNITSNISISFWAKLETSGPYYFPYHIIEKFDCWGLGQRGNDINWGVTTSNGGFNVWALDFNYTQWYYYVMKYDGSNISTYVNGQLYASEQASGTINTNTNKIYISRYNEGGDYYFDGTLDDFRIYNRSVSVLEINELYHEGGWDI